MYRVSPNAIAVVAVVNAMSIIRTQSSTLTTSSLIVNHSGAGRHAVNRTKRLSGSASVPVGHAVNHLVCLPVTSGLRAMLPIKWCFCQSVLLGLRCGNNLMT